MDEGVKKLLSQMKEQHDRDTQIMQDLIKQLIPQRISQPEEKGQEFTIEALSSNITEFCFDPESNLTFDMWYARYEDLFTVDAAKLDDAAKVRLLLRKLNTVVHNKYINYILPKHPRDLTFKETVEKLKQLFGLQTSLFNIRFNCLQLTKPHTTDFVTYAGTVNRHCENFKLKELTLDQFKCLVFVMGLKSEGDFDIRTKMLSKLDTDTALTLDGLSKECQRLINLKTDTKLIEHPKNEVVVKRLHTGNAKAKQVPKTPCWFCGGMHYSRECSYSKHKCEQCKETGHKEGYCHSKKSVQRKKQKHNNKFKASRPQSKSICVVNRINTSLRKFVNISINNTKLTLQLDTASDITIISEQNYKKINTSNGVEVKDTARSATGKLPLTLQFQCKVTFKQQELELTCFVTPVRDLNVLGLDWITALGLENMSINAICNHVKAEPLGSEVTKTNKNILLLKQSFPDVFEEKLGLCKYAKAHLVVEPGRSPIFRPKRPVAYAIQHLVEEELQRLQDINVISPVSHSEWAAPIVVTKKSNGSIRICADFSTGLNAALEAYQYPLPLPEDIFSKLANAKFFSHIDLSDAFLQIEVDDKSKELLTINTHLGLFRYNRMIFGIKTFPAIFQQVMDKMLSGLDCAAAYIDDIFVSGRNELEHDRNLREVLRRIQDYGFKIKFAKCKFAVTEVKYLGYIISPDGLRPDPERVSAIKDMPEPTNVTELRSFLGAINFYGKFINKMRQLRGPLDELLKANVKWHWTSIQRNCFNSLKDILSSNLLLTHYDPNKEIIVAADASNYGLGACILHEGPDGSIKAVCHASRSLTPAEKGYSQIEKEGLALVFAVTKFHKMIFGRRFKLHTDHKPLLTIFGKKTGISAHQANRLQRWALQLLAYDFEISFISTNSFGYADVLSRLISKSNKASEDYVIASVKFEGEIKKILSDAIDKLPVTHSMIKYETEKDKTLKQLLDYIEHGWADNADIGVELKQFRLRSDNLSIIDGCIMLGQRVVIPAMLRKRILKQIHKGHPGMERTKAIARSYVYWPHIDSEIEELVRNCSNCASAAKMPNKTTLRPWPKPSCTWERLHIDYAGPIENEYFLVLVDAYSKWPEIVPTKSITAQQTIDILTEIFARFGTPRTIVSDNGTQFTSALFQQFLEGNGIEHLRSSPYYPMSNGQAERFVDTFKRALTKLNGEGTTHKILQTFLQCYRSTPNKNNENNRTPAEVLLGKNIHTNLDLMKPKPVINRQLDQQQQSMKRQFDRAHGAKEKLFQPKDKVYASVFKGKNKFKWIPGEVIERVGNVIYNVLLSDGKLIRAHANQLRKRTHTTESAAAAEENAKKTLIDAFGLYDGTHSETEAQRELVSGETQSQASPKEPSPTLKERLQRIRRPVERFVPT